MKFLELVKRYPGVSIVIGVILSLILMFLLLSLKSRPSDTIGVSPEAVDAHNRAEREKGAADELRRQKTELEKELEEQRTKNVELEQELERAKQETEDARKAYEASRNTKPRVTPVDGSTSTDSLCTRAERLGISCQ